MSNIDRVNNMSYGQIRRDLNKEVKAGNLHPLPGHKTDFYELERLVDFLVEKGHLPEAMYPPVRGMSVEDRNAELAKHNIGVYHVLPHVWAMDGDRRHRLTIVRAIKGLWRMTYVKAPLHAVLGGLARRKPPSASSDQSDDKDGDSDADVCVA